MHTHARAGATRELEPNETLAKWKQIHHRKSGKINSHDGFILKRSHGSQRTNNANCCQLTWYKSAPRRLSNTPGPKALRPQGPRRISNTPKTPRPYGPKALGASATPLRHQGPKAPRP